jgi:hypothetical protein
LTWGAFLRAQSGLADIAAWVQYMGVGWCGEVADARAALEHAGQAVRYLLVGKDDCVRKATKARTRVPLPWAVFRLLFPFFSPPG